MGKNELLTGIEQNFQGKVPPQFPEGSRIEREDITVYIYDPSGDRRWRIQEFVMDWEHIRHRDLELQGKRREGWHLLMGAYEGTNANTGVEVEKGVTIDVMTGARDDGIYSTVTKGHAQYSSRREGELHIGSFGVGKARIDDVMDGLDRLSPLAKWSNELPRRIKVNPTIVRLAETFQEGKFEPPQFVLPDVPVAQDTTSRYQQFRSRVRRVFDRNNATSPSRSIQKKGRY